MFLRLSAVVAAVALTVVAVPLAAHADGGTTYVWVGSSQNPAADNHSWTDSRNWQPNGVPGDGDSVVIAPPDASHCTAAVDGVPSVTLAGLSITAPPTLCGTSLTGGPITVTGSFDWDGGALQSALTLAAGSTGLISASNGIRNSVSQNIEVDGSLELANLSGRGALFFANSGTLHLTVGAGGTLTSTGATELSALSCCNAPAAIVNHGTMRVASGRMHAAGIEIDQDGTLYAAHSAVLDTDGGLATAPTGAQYTGAGTWTIENQARLRLSGAQVLGTAFHLQLGTIGAASGATLGGSFTLRGGGTFDWSAGTIGGTITVAHTAHVDVSGVTTGNGRRQLAATDPISGGSAPSRLTNHGAVAVDNGGAFSAASATTVTNAADGVLSLASGTTIDGSSCCVSPAILANHGRLAAGTAADAAPVTLPSMGYRDGAGTIAIAAGATLQLAHGPRHSLSGTHLTGGGTLQIGGATSVARRVALSNATVLALVNGGSLDGTATINGAGSVQWTGGSMSGDLTVAPGAGTSVSGAAVKSVTLAAGGVPSTVHVDTALTFAPGTSSAHDVLDLGSSDFVLGGRSTVPAFVEIHAGSLTNNATMTVTAGTDHADRSGPTETTVNTGTISVVSGTLALANTYEQDAGTLAITAKAAGSGRLTVVHAASVSGTLHMTDNYVPPAGTTLTVLSSAGLTWSGAVTSSGKGTPAGQWVAAPTATALAVQWQAS